jgi:hypothetical protein
MYGMQISTGFKHAAAMAITLIALVGSVSAALACGECREHKGGQALEQIRTFRVADFHHQFSVDRHYPSPDLPSYLKSAMNSTPALRQAEDADGWIHLTCTSERCNRVKAVVTAGEKGPSIWEATYGYKRYWSWDGKADGMKLADKIVADLAAAYQKDVPVGDQADAR